MKPGETEEDSPFLHTAGLLHIAPLFWDVPIDPIVTQVVESVLGADFLLSTFSGIDLKLRGTSIQPLHPDDALVPVGRLWYAGVVKPCLVALFLLSLSLSPTNAFGGSTTWQFTSNFDGFFSASIFDAINVPLTSEQVQPLFDAIGPDASLVARVTFDPETGVVSDSAVQIGELFGSGSSGSVIHSVRFPDGPFPVAFGGILFPLELQDPDVGLELSVSLELYDSSQPLFSNDPLPAVPPDLAGLNPFVGSFDNSKVTLLIGPVLTLGISRPIDSLSSAPIPEPSSGLVFALGAWIVWRFGRAASPSSPPPIKSTKLSA